MFSIVKNYIIYIVGTIAFTAVLSAAYSYYKYDKLCVETNNTISNLKLELEDKTKEINRLNLVIESDTFSNKWEVQSKLPVTEQPMEVTYEEIKHSIDNSTTITF